MGCSSSKSTTALDDNKAATGRTPAKATATPTATEKKDNKMAEYPASEAFTIPLDDTTSAPDQLNDTLRQPPKRLQQLMQQAAEAEPLTLLELEDRQQKAEQRRQELMQQKIETIQKNTQALMRAHSELSDGEEQPQETLK
ncbi:hypothetical protein KR215_000510 [Drosophila sulfurigaster]|nr:hypothetical protein KR215_000510 [Drosophila sulfurigaster]